jgi:hypothetical protein
MCGLSRVLYLIAALLVVSTARAELVEETLDHATFGKIAVYRATDEPKGGGVARVWRGRLESRPGGGGASYRRSGLRGGGYRSGRVSGPNRPI